jgi:hypothetical protein
MRTGLFYCLILLALTDNHKKALKLKSTKKSAPHGKFFLLTPNLRRNVHDNSSLSCHCNRGYGSGSARAVDPDSLNPDTNPAFKVTRIRIQSRSRVMKKKIHCEEQNTSEIFWIKNCNFGLRPPYRTTKLQEKPSVLKREHPEKNLIC